MTLFDIIFSSSSMVLEGHFEGHLASTLVEDVHQAFALCVQVRRSLRVEQGHHVRAQHPERTAMDRALRRDHHPEHQEQRLPLQTHLCQGGWKTPTPQSVARRLTEKLTSVFVGPSGELLELQRQ